MKISARFEDVSGGGYSFAKPVGFDEWYYVPRVGDHILDLNEFRYRVETVTWYDPGSVRLRIRRDE